MTAHNATRAASLNPASAQSASPSDCSGGVHDQHGASRTNSFLSLPSTCSPSDSVSPCSSVASSAETSAEGKPATRHTDPHGHACKTSSPFGSLGSAISDGSADADASLPTLPQPPLVTTFARAWVALPLGWVWDPVAKRSVRCRDTVPYAMPHRSPGKLATRGCAGLANMGNTCFMNSALQCLSHTTLLDAYFAGDHYVHDIALGNFNGKDGAVATAFSQLLKQLWCGRYRAFAPREFKSNVSGFFEFAMHQQHDAQEFLLFLLDGLHEDVNKAAKDKAAQATTAPVANVEDATPAVADSPATPPSLSRGEKLAREYKDAASSWDAHLARNKSTVQDLFYGQYKSTMQCNVCHHESVSHDPMLFLQVPVFTEAMEWQYVRAVFYPLDRTVPPTHYQFKVKKSGSVSQILRDVQAQLRAQANCLTMHLFVWGDERSWLPLHDEITFEQLRPRPDTMFGVFEHLPMPKTVPPKVGVKPTECTDVLVRVDHWMDEEDDIREPLGEASLIRGARDMNNAELHQYVREACGDGAELVGLSAAGVHAGEAMEDSPHVHDVADLFVEACRAQGDRYTGHRREHHIIRPKLVSVCAVWRQLEKRPAPVAHASVHASTHLDDSRTLRLTDCLRRHTTTEQLDDQNAWLCPQCKVKQCAFKTLTLWKLPKYLMIHQKKLFFTQGTYHKIDTEVSYPVRGLDVRLFLDENVRAAVRNTTYDLYAAVMHYGSASYGHCTALAYHKGLRRWMTYDDDRVAFADDDEIKDSSAYILFYELRDEHSVFAGCDSETDSLSD